MSRAREVSEPPASPEAMESAVAASTCPMKLVTTAEASARRARFCTERNDMNLFPLGASERTHPAPADLHRLFSSVPRTFEAFLLFS
jgi:hypothetical protein